MNDGNNSSPAARSRAREARYHTIREQGNLVHAQLLDEYDIVVSETYEYDDAYHLFHITSLTGKVWFDIEDEERLATLRDYVRVTVQLRLQRTVWPRQVIGLRYKRWIQRGRYYKIKHQLDETESLAPSDTG